MPAPPAQPRGARRLAAGEPGAPAQASPRGSRRSGRSSGEKQRPSPPPLVILPPARDRPLPSFPRPLPREVERRGARSRALREPGWPDGPGGSLGRLAPPPEPGSSSPRRAGATRPASSSPRRLLPPPPPASRPAPASAGSRSPPLGELQTRKRQPPQPRQEPRAARLQVQRSGAPESRACRAPGAGRTGGGARGRGASGPPAGPALRALPALCGPGAPAGGGRKAKGSGPSPSRHLRPGRQVRGCWKAEGGGAGAGNPRSTSLGHPPYHRGSGRAALPGGPGEALARRARGGQVPFPDLNREGSSRAQLGTILFVRLSCRE